MPAEPSLASRLRAKISRLGRIGQQCAGCPAGVATFLFARAGSVTCAQRGLHRLTCALILGITPFLLMACVPSLQLPYQAEAELAQAEWMVRPIEEAWVHSPGSQLLLERRAAGLMEQRLTLPNRTGLRGENLLHLRAVTRTSRASRFDLDEVLALIDGIPPPFSETDLQALQSRSDMAGDLHWAEWTNGAGVTCVLALRRLDVGARLLPSGARAIDLVMRNCVHDDPAVALGPVGPSVVAYPAHPAISEGAPLRTLSPLAAPGI